MQSAFAESFNGKFRDECLNENLFDKLAQARNIIETWRIDYDINRPHKLLVGQITANFSQQQISAPRVSLGPLKYSAQQVLTKPPQQKEKGADFTSDRPGSRGNVKWFMFLCAWPVTLYWVDEGCWPTVQDA